MNGFSRRCTNAVAEVFAATIPLRNPRNARIHRLVFFLVCGFVLCCVNSNSADAAQVDSNQGRPKLTTVLPTQTIRVAEPFDVKLAVVSTDPAVVELLDDMPNTPDDFDIVGRRLVGPVPISMTQKDATYRFQTTLILAMETARAGRRNLPEIKLKVSAAGAVFNLSSDPATVDVKGIVPKDHNATEFRELKPAVEARTTAETTRTGFWFVAAFASLIGAMFFFYRKSRTSNAAIRRRWIAEIDLLENGLRNRAIGLPESHDETCHLIRRWIQATADIPASSLPADKLIIELESKSWPEPLLDRLSNMLRRNDRIKFAAEAIGQEQANTVFNDARWVVGHPMTVQRSGDIS